MWRRERRRRRRSGEGARGGCGGEGGGGGEVSWHFLGDPPAQKNKKPNSSLKAAGERSCEGCSQLTRRAVGGSDSRQVQRRSAEESPIQSRFHATDSQEAINCTSDNLQSFAVFFSFHAEVASGLAGSQSLDREVTEQTEKKSWTV